MANTVMGHRSFLLGNSKTRSLSHTMHEFRNKRQPERLQSCAEANSSFYVARASRALVRKSTGAGLSRPEN